MARRKFYYSLSGADGSTVQGVITAEDDLEARSRLMNQGLVGFSISDRPFTVASSEPQSETDRVLAAVAEASRSATAQDHGTSMRDWTLRLIRRFQLKRSLWTTRERGLFLRQLGVMYQHGITLSAALNHLSTQDNVELKLSDKLKQIREKVEQGIGLPKALEASELFRAEQIELMNAGDKAGQLPKVLDWLGEEEERREWLQAKVRSASLYPLIVCAFAAVLLFVIPRICFAPLAQLYAQLHVDLKWPTRAVMAFTSLTQLPGAWLIGLIALTLTGLYLGDEGRRLAMARRLPLLRQFTLDMAWIRVARVLALSLRSGVSLAEAVRISFSSPDDPRLNPYIRPIQDNLMHGVQEAFLACPLTPSLWLGLLEVGEQIGELPTMSELYAQYAEGRCDATLERMLGLLEPILLGGMGLLVGFIVVAFMLPMGQVLSAL